MRQQEATKTYQGEGKRCGLFYLAKWKNTLGEISLTTFH